MLRDDPLGHNCYTYALSHFFICANPSTYPFLGPLALGSNSLRHAVPVLKIGSPLPE